jgi:[calcium/calmodulin-dependent protein kinase] kinase
MKDALADVKREVAIMKKIKHPNLIALHEVIDNPDQDKIIMVLDYANEGQIIEWDED